MLTSLLTQTLVLVALVLLASAAWSLLRRRDGVFRVAGRAGTARDVLTPADLGDDLGPWATFVLVSSPVCATCPQARRVLHAVAADHPAVRLAEVRAEERPDLVRRLGVLRTPTVLLLDRDGRVRARTSGPMRPDQARDALAALEADVC